VATVCLDRFMGRRLGFTLLEFLVVALVMIWLPNVPFGGWVIVIGLVSYGVYRYVGFCRRNPSIWQMRWRARRQQGKEDQRGVGQ
jgi:hypothetical protein